MKIGVHDIQHIIGQIKRASPPTTKYMHKLINNLAILLEKNTNKLESPQEAVLTAQLERLNELFLDLCFMRKELALKYADNYAASVSAAMDTLRENGDVVSTETPYAPIHIDWALDAQCGDTDMLVHEIFSKMRKAKTVIEDASDKTRERPGLPTADSMLSSYLNRI